jgi:hypothetical protein
MENKRLKYTTYLAGAIEAISSKEMKLWREEIRERLASPDLGVYDPVLQESKKVGKSSKAQCEYIAGLKQGGHWEEFIDEMDKIWWGKIDISKLDRIRLLIYLYEKARIEGNYLTDLDFWGDTEAVVRSDFIIVYFPKDVKTVGTIFEIRDAYLLGIPIYLILPDQSQTESNSTLIYAVKKDGKVFYSIKECCDFIKEKYKLTMEKK